MPEVDGHRITIDGREHRVSIVADDRIEIDGQCLPVHVRWRADAGAAHAGWLDLGGVSAGFSDVSALPPRRAVGNASGDVRATMHGQVAALSVAAGDRVRAGQPRSRSRR